MRLVIPIAAVLVVGAAQAQEPSPPVRGAQGWSVLSGQTVGNGATVLAGAIGWPGISATLLQGVSPRVDVGGRLSVNYGVEGIVTDVTLGMKLQGMLRLAVVDTRRFNLGVHFAPGPLFYFYTGYTLVGLTLPVGFALGIPVGAAIMLNLGMDFPLYVVFGAGGGAVLPVLVGGGAEYFIDQRLSVSFNARMGPSAGGAFPVSRRTAPFTLQALVGVALKL